MENEVLVMIGGFISLVTGILGVVGWVNKRIKEEIIATRAITASEIRSLGRSIDDVREDVNRCVERLSHHDKKISQADVVMVHIDDTMKQLAGTVSKLDETLNALRVSFAKIEVKRD